MKKKVGDRQRLSVALPGAIIAALSCLGAGTATWAADLSGARFNLDIAPQKLTTALVALSRQTQAQVVSDTKVLGDLNSPGASGEMSLQEALNTLLAGTRLSYKTTGDGVIAIGAFAESSSPAAPAAQTTEQLEEIIVSGTKIDAPIAEAPQSISVLSRDDLELRGVQSMTEALRYVPGTVVDNYGYEARGYEYVMLRGFDALYTGNYRDGLNQATGLYFASFVTEPYSVEQIEVIRGPSSALFGQSDAGGIINRTSKRPGVDVRPEVEVQLGNRDRKQAAADFGGALNDSGSLAYRLVSLVRDTETQQRYPNGDRPSQNDLFVAPSLRWRPSDATSFTLLTDYRKGDTKGYGFYAARADGSFSNVLKSDPAHSRYLQEQGSVGYQFEHRFSDMWTVRQNARFARAEVEVDEVFPLDFAEDGHTLERYAVSTDETLDQLQVDTQLHANFDLGATAHNLLVGFDISRTDADLLFLMGAATSLDLDNPVYGLPIDEPSLLVFDATQENRQSGIYLQDQIKFAERWIVTVGSRYDWAKSRTVDHDVAITTSFRDEAFTGRAGLTYRFDNGLAPYVSYTESFLPQGGRDFNGNPFEPSNGTQYEIGVKYQPRGGRGLFTAAIFDLTKDNILTPDIDHEGFSYTAGERRSRGLELEATTALTPSLDVSAAYTYLDAEVTESNDVDRGNRPIQLPEHTASVWLDYSFQGSLQGLGVSFGARYVGERFEDWENLVESASYTLVDAGVRYERGAWRFALNSANLFNKHYFAAYNAFNYFPGSDRTVTATMKYRW